MISACKVTVWKGEESGMTDRKLNGDEGSKKVCTIAFSAKRRISLIALGALFLKETP